MAEGLQSEFPLVDRLNVLARYRRRLILLFLTGFSGAILQICSDRFGWGIQALSFKQAVALLAFFNPITFYVALSYYRRLITVGISARGMNFVRSRTIEWSQMDEIHLNEIKGLPHISLKERTEKQQYNIPLFVRHFDSFIQELKSRTPKGHPLLDLIPTIERIKIDELPTQVKWWQI